MYVRDVWEEAHIREIEEKNDDDNTYWYFLRTKEKKNWGFSFKKCLKNLNFDV